MFRTPLKGGGVFLFFFDLGEDDMLAKRSCVAVLGVLVLCVGWAGSASGQIIGSARIRQESYRVKIVSHFGIPVTVGIFGKQTDATFRLRFDGGRTGPDVYTQNLIAGQRVVCVWDSSGDLLFIADLNIDASGTLELPGPAEYGAARRDGAAMRDEAAAPARAPRPNLPTLKIQP
jgi:hypothetical protein